MPAYDYRCESCSHVFERIQRITEPSGATCPACAGSVCVRLITGGTFHLKGSGWYASDYGTKKAAAEAPPAAAAGDKAPAADTAAADTSAAKADTATPKPAPTAAEA